MTDGMGRPTRRQWQNPKYSGYARGWYGCTPHAVASAGDEGSVNTILLTGKTIHAETGDTVGGTSLPQCVPSLTRRGLKVELHVGSQVCTPFYLAYQLQAGRCVTIQINTRPFLPTKFRSTATDIPHAVTLLDARGGTPGNPDEVLMDDPAADGRVAGWGKASTGPQWVPWAKVKDALAALQVNGPNEPRLGPGKAYCAIMPDTKPHVHLRYGGSRSTPFPDRTRVDNASVWLRSSPAYGKANHVRKLDRNTLFVSYQRVTKSGVLWLGNHDGTRWVRAAAMRNIGGTQ